MIRAFDLLALLDPGISSKNSKIHLATWTGKDNPLDVYRAGEFPEWQRWQTQKNFERDQVVSLIALPQQNYWLFAGAYNSYGTTPHKDSTGKFVSDYYYRLDERMACAQLNGRLVVKFKRPGRQSYLRAERWEVQILLHELRAEPMSMAEFPGYRQVDISKADLDLIVRQSLESWRTALSNVSGIYLISDAASGGLYIGSAYGEGGIWQRWATYSRSGHGGNEELIRILKNEGASRADSFRFSVLEIADINESPENLFVRESHWKKILLSRAHGLNLN